MPLNTFKAGNVVFDPGNKTCAGQYCNDISEDHKTPRYEVINSLK